jgi:hypothetical protein
MKRRNCSHMTRAPLVVHWSAAYRVLLLKGT